LGTGFFDPAEIVGTGLMMGLVVLAERSLLVPTIRNNTDKTNR
jgi:hypothetical protein